MSAWFPSIHEPSLAGGCCIERALQLARGATQSWSGGAGALGFYGLLWSTSGPEGNCGHTLRRPPTWPYPIPKVRVQLNQEELLVSLTVWAPSWVASIVATLGWWGMRESVWWKGCLVSFFLIFFSKYYAKKGILLYTSTLTVTIFLQSAISLETKKTNTCPALRPWSNPWEVVGAIWHIQAASGISLAFLWCFQSFIPQCGNV